LIYLIEYAKLSIVEIYYEIKNNIKETTVYEENI